MSKSDAILGAGVQIAYSESIPPGSSQLNGAINASVTSLTLDDGSVYPDPGASGPFILVIGLEVMKCTARATNVLTVIRGWGGTTPATHADNALASGGYLCLAQLEDATPPKKNRDDVEISNHDSANRKKEWIPGWLDASAPNFRFIYKAADHLAVDTLVENGTFVSWICTSPDGHYQTFRGYVKDAGKATPLKDKMTRDMTIKIDDGSIVEH